ncbi:GNAT family N-acetyltransferase [Chromobacterium phragmitis]|uniref:GNAT family N-acetyltransferase n=1 Tax=Chromobacterium phragmitis TaxID=2202141 RepID=UPI001914F3DF|nr:GNAT family N-acetyltransferase [Chromobacterium phragmitis]
MPDVNVQITAGATREQKAALVKDITDSLVRHLGKKPEHTHIVIQEIRAEDWGYAGQLTDDWKRRQGSGWGSGIATAACACLLQWGHCHIGLARIQATVLPENARSIRVLERVGFQREGLLRS